VIDKRNQGEGCCLLIVLLATNQPLCEVPYGAVFLSRVFPSEHLPKVWGLVFKGMGVVMRTITSPSSFAISWIMVYGLWIMVYGLWVMGYGLWFAAYGLLPVWFQVMWFGIRNFTSSSAFPSSIPPLTSLVTAAGANQSLGFRVQCSGSRGLTFGTPDPPASGCMTKHRHTDTQTHRHTDTQTHRHTDTQTHRHTDTQTHAYAHKYIHTHTHENIHRREDTPGGRANVLVRDSP
jgi:hypothetical protein